MSGSLDDMYRDIILDHYRAPRGRQPIDRTDISSDGMNPSCGDEIAMDVQTKDGVLENIHVDCKGCAISVASGSMLAEAVKGKPLEEVRKLTEAVRKMLKGESEEIPEEFDDLESLKGVRNFPVRIKCALLAWITLLEGLDQYAKGNNSVRASVSTEDYEPSK